MTGSFVTFLISSHRRFNLRRCRVVGDSTPTRHSRERGNPWVSAVAGPDPLERLNHFPSITYWLLAYNPFIFSDLLAFKKSALCFQQRSGFVRNVFQFSYPRFQPLKEPA